MLLRISAISSPRYCFSARFVLSSFFMKTLTMKVPEDLFGWLEREAKRVRQPKSAFARHILREQQRRGTKSALDLASDLCGSVESGIRDLATNKKHLKGFGK